MATKDVEPVWETEALPGWVVHHLIPLLTAGQSWPKGSESKLWELRVEYVKLMNLLIGTLDPTATTVQTLNGSLQSPAKPAIFKRLAKLSDDKAGVVAKAQESFSYAKMVDNFARETQYSKLSVNVAFWVAVIAAFIALIAAGFSPLASLLLRSVGTAGASRIALIMERLALLAARSGPVAASGQVTKLAGTGNKFFNAALAFELVEEISEELAIDALAQYQQIKMGTRDTWDWKKIQAAAIGAGTGAVVGTKLGGPMSRFTDNLPGVSRLNRIAGDNRGVGNAFLRFPGRALNTGLNNMVASPAGSVVANYAVYDQFSLPGAEGMYGGFLGGAGRTNTISPFNPSVAGAIVNPMSTLSGVFDSAIEAQQGSAGTMGGPAAGDSSATTGPRPGSPDGVAPVVPPQRQAVDTAGPSMGPTRRDSTGTGVDPAGQQPGRKGTQTAPAPDIVTPDTSQTNRSQQGNDAKAQQDLPAPRQEVAPDVQNQAEDQDRGPVSQPTARDAAPTAQQQPAPAPNQAPDQALAEPSGTPTDAPEQSSTPTSTPDPANAPEPAAAADPASAPAAATAPEPAGTPENSGEPHTSHAPEPVDGTQDAGPPDTVTTSETAGTATATAPSADRQPAVSPAPALPAPNAPGLVTRLISGARRTRDTHATVTGRPIKKTRFVADGRHEDVPPLTVQEARAAFEAEVRASDLGDTVTGLRWTGPATLVVELNGLPDQTFTFEVGRVPRRRLGRTLLRTGHLNEVRLALRVAPDQVARLVLHEIADTLQARNHPRQGPLRRLATLPGDRDECLTARLREEAFLSRRIAEASADQRPALEAERDAVRDILLARGLWQPPPAPAVQTPPSVADLISRLREHDQAVGPAVRELNLALMEQIDQLLQIELNLQLQAMATAGTTTDPLLIAVAQARAAYEDAQSLTGGSPAQLTKLARALHRAHQLHQRYEEQAQPVAALPALTEMAPGPDALRRHIAALRAADLSIATSASSLTAADRNAAAAAATQSAEVYQSLLDQMDQASQHSATLPSAYVSQMLRLGATYEQHYRQVTGQEQVPTKHGAEDIARIREALLKNVSGRQATALALRSTIEAFDAVVDAQHRTVGAYHEAARQANALATDAQARGDVDAARTRQAAAGDLIRIAGLQEEAERAAIAARDAHRELADLLDTVVKGGPVDLAQLNVRADAAAAALRAYQEMIARLPPATPPAPLIDPTPPPDTALSRLRQETDDRANALAAAQQHSTELSLRHQRDAAQAREKALAAWGQATRHSGDQDDSARERRRKAEVEAELATSIEAHHTRMAELYEAAAAAAGQALQAVDPLRAGLDGVNRPDKPMTLQVELALQELKTRSEAYDQAHQAALPSPKALTGTYPAGPIAGLGALNALVNDLLTQQGVAAPFTEEQLRYAIRQAFRTAVSPDGMVLRLNTSTGAELRIRLKLDDLKEVVNPGTSHSETMIGLLRQGGGETSTTGALSHDVAFNGNLVPLLAWTLMLIPGLDLAAEAARLVAEHAVLNAKLGWGDEQSVSTSSQSNWLGGNVEDNRGMSAMFDARANWEVELVTESGRVTRTLEAGAERQSLWISHAYLTGPPGRILQLEEADRQQVPFPEHVVTGLTGLTALGGRVADQLEAAGLSPVARNQVITTITEDLPSYLGEAINNPSGLQRTITVNGRVRAVVTVHTEVAPGGTPVGGPSTKHHQERLRNGSSTAGKNRSDADHKSGVAEGGVAPNLMGARGMDQKGEWGGKLTGSLTPSRSAAASTSVNATAIHPSVQRWAGHTQGYVLDLTHTVTVQLVGAAPVTLPPEQSAGLFRIPEPDAYRYGLPVDAEAETGRAADGTILLRDDPDEADPPGRVGEPPTWYGDDPGQTRGAGPALVQQVTGMDSVRAEVERYLRGKGVLPQLVNGVPVYSASPVVRASQIANEQLVAEQFSAERLETGYDQAAQEGLFINLVHHRWGRAAEHYTLRITLEQDFTQIAYQGVTSAEPVVNLDIGSDTYSVTRKHGSTLTGSVQAGPEFKNDPGLDWAGTANAGFSYGKGNQITTTTGSTVNQVKLIEGGGLTAVLRIPHTIRVDRLTGPDHAEPVVEDEAGDARVLLPADLLPLSPSADGHPRPESPRHPTSPAALRLATIAHLDAGAVATEAANRLATRLDRDSPQFQHLAAFFNVRGLISHPEVFTSGLRTGVHTPTMLGGLRHQPVSLRLTPGESRFLSATDLVVGDINLTLGSHAGSTQRSTTKGGGVTAGGPLHGTTGSEEGAAGSWSTTTTREGKVIAGPERLGIDTSKKYAFAMDVTPELTVGSGADAETTELSDGTVIYLLAERDALDLYASGEVQLPLHQAADAAERLMNGNLKLGRRIAIRFMARYLQDLDQARGTNAGRPDVPGVPLTSGHTRHGALRALLELFPENRLIELMPPGVPAGQPSEKAAETRERMLSRPEFYLHVLDNLLAAAQRLENGEVPAELAPAYGDSIGMSTVKQVSLHPATEPDTEVELLSQIVSAVNEVAPGALDQDTELWQALATDYSRETWLGKIDDLLDPDSPGGDYVVRVDGVEDLLEITVRVELGPDVAYRGEIFDYGQILQRYTMLEDNTSESASTTGSPSFKGAVSAESGAATTDRGHTSTGASNLQQTRVERVASFNGPQAEVRQGIRISVEVRKSPAVQRNPPNQSVPSPPSVAAREVSGTIDRIIPAGMVSHPGAAPAPAPAVPDPRPIPAPENFAVETTRVKGLAQAVEQRLRDELGVKLSRADSRTLARLLSGNFRNGHFKHMTAEDGHLVIPLLMGSGEVVHIHVGAVLSEPVVIATGQAETEIGQIDRRQWTTKASASRSRLLPTTLSAGSNNQNTWFSAISPSWVPSWVKFGSAGSYRNQAGDASSVSGGNRDETTVSEKADGSSVTFRVDYNVRFEVWSDPDTGLKPSRTIPAQHIATGSADLILFDNALQTAENQAESPRAVDPAGERPVQNVPARPSSLAELHARPDVNDLAGLARVLADQSGRINLDADLPGPPYGQLRQAQLLAREAGADVQITIHPRHGGPQTYIATPGGLLHAQGHDGGFGPRFAGLPSLLIAMADQHRIDLHGLHERTKADEESLAERLRHELNRRAIPMPAAPAPGRPVQTTPDDTGGPHGSDSTHGSPDPDSGFVPDGRTGLDDLTDAEARESFIRETMLSDFGEAITEITWGPGGQLIVHHTTLGELHFTVQVGPVEGGYLGETSVRGVAGSSDDPHIMTLAPRVARDQVARLVLHEISDVIQYRLEGEHTGSPEEARRNECITARRNELRFLGRKHRAALATGDTAAAEKLAGEIAAVERDLAARTRPSGSIDDLINWAESEEQAALDILGEPDPVGANVSIVTLSDESPALLLEHSTRRERDLQLLVTRLAGRLGLVDRASAAGDRHILIDFTPADASPGFLGTREAVLAGYLIALADMTPLVARPALHVLAGGRPLLELFLRADASGQRDWGSNPLTWSDVQKLGTMLEAARADFAQIGALSDFERIMDRHRLIAANAAGTEDVVTAAPGQHLAMAVVERVAAMDEDLGRLKANLRHGIASQRQSALGPVVTFADGSHALQIPRRQATEVLVRALVRRALGLPGPAVHLDQHGRVYRTLGSDRLRASAATGIDHVIDGSPQPNGTTTVVFGDGRQALRHVFPTSAAANEYEARLEESNDVTDGQPRSYRADSYTIYEEIVASQEHTAETEARLATRALYTFLSLSRPMAHETLKRLLDVNPLLVQFGQAFDWDFRAGAPVLSERDVTDLAARFEALRDAFSRQGLSDPLERILGTLRSFVGSDDARLISLTFSEALTTAGRSTPEWQPSPQPGPILGDLLQGDHLHQVNVRLQTDVISRADAELAERPRAEGHVFAWVPDGVIPADIRPGSEFTVETLLDGVDNIDLLSNGANGVRVTILASDYVPVADLSGNPHQALFRAGARFAVTAMLTGDDGRPHYFLIQQPLNRTGPVITPTIGLTPARARHLAHDARTAVSKTATGVRIHGDGHEALHPAPRAVPGVGIVQGRFSEHGTWINGRFVTTEEVAALLLNSPGLQPDQAILLADPDGGTTAFARNLAELTGRIVIAADGPVETTAQGNLQVGATYRSSPAFHIFLPGDSSVAVAELLRTWLAPEVAPAVPLAGAPGSTSSLHVDAALSRSLDESAGRASAPALTSRHRNLILEHRREVVSGIWYRDENTPVMPTADPRLLRLTPGIIDVAIAGDGTSFLIGSERLSAADLATMLAHDPRVIGHPSAKLRILGGETARNQAVLQELADLTGRSVLAADQIVYIGADRQPHTAAIQLYGSDGRPFLPPGGDDQWPQANPAVPATRPAAPAAVRSQAIAPRRGLPPDLVEAAVAADPASWRPLGSGEDGRVDVLVLADGTLVARKIMVRGRRAEILGSIVGQRLGANVPVVVAHPADRHAILMEYVPGSPPPRGTNLNSRRGAMLLELLDILIINNDRHKGNLIVTDDGVMGIDHGRAFELGAGGKARLEPIHLYGNFLELGAGDTFHWTGNPLSRQDVELLTEIVMSLRPDYQEYGFHTAYDVALDRLYHIGMHATGRISLIAPAASAPGPVQHHFEDRDEVARDSDRRPAPDEDLDRSSPT
ncbi:hypothetical protein ACFO0F_46495 [Nonomuraea zeae]